jgi:hypothetical protein
MQLRLSDHLPHWLARSETPTDKASLIGRFGKALWSMHRPRAPAELTLQAER